ncbi:MAG: serine hydrolase domain-containing protein [Bacteroidota bacterium]
MRKLLFLSIAIISIAFLLLQSTSSKKVAFANQERSSVQSVPPAPEFVSLLAAKKRIEEMVQEENIVGLSISISLDDTLIWSAGYGYSDLEKQTPIDPSETVFRITSIAKPFTTTILGRLYEEGKIDWTKSLYHYVPDFPKKRYDFTLQQLALHRAGIRHYHWYEGENKKPLSIEQGLKKFKRSRLRFEPGTEYLYSSYGYNLLGVAMEKASGQSYEQLLAEYITRPLQLEHTIADDADYKNLRTSGFFTTKGKGKVWEAEAVNMYMKLPCGGILSTSEDLVQFGNAYSYGRILQENTRQTILLEPTLPDGKKVGYSMGWGLTIDKQGRKIISHTGGNTGAVCRLIVYPDQKLSIAVVSNTFGIDYLKFIRNLSSIANGILLDIER